MWILTSALLRDLIIGTTRFWVNSLYTLLGVGGISISSIRTIFTPVAVYPLVIKHSCSKWPSRILSFPKSHKKCDFPVRYVAVYQRVSSSGSHLKSRQGREEPCSACSQTTTRCFSRVTGFCTSKK